MAADPTTLPVLIAALREATVGSPAPDRTCEGCENTFPTQTEGWYVDPEGCELCPSCATELHEAWQTLSLEDQVAYGLRS